MRETRASVTECSVVQFFFSRDAFDTELRLYSNVALANIMPKCYAAHDNADGHLRDDRGRAFPPVLVMGRGESLDEFVARVEYEEFTVLQALVLVVKRIVALHGLGIVHRDLKPSNILRMPELHSWALIDFGCAAYDGTFLRPRVVRFCRYGRTRTDVYRQGSRARAGCEASLSFTLTYAPPEVVRAYKDGERSITAKKSADIWSLGVIAYEMLVGSPTFPAGTHPDIVIDAVMGRVPLPWESATAAELRPLMRLKHVTLQCLHRDESKRPDAQQVLGAMQGIFRAATTTTRRTHIV